MAFLQAHQALILMCLLSVSEMMAFVFPKAGGILAAMAQGLRMLGAKDQDGK